MTSGEKVYLATIVVIAGLCVAVALYLPYSDQKRDQAIATARATAFAQLGPKGAAQEGASAGHTKRKAVEVSSATRTPLALVPDVFPLPAPAEERWTWVACNPQELWTPAQREGFVRYERDLAPVCLQLRLWLLSPGAAVSNVPILEPDSNATVERRAVRYLFGDIDAALLKEDVQRAVDNFLAARRLQRLKAERGSTSDLGLSSGLRRQVDELLGGHHLSPEQLLAMVAVLQPLTDPELLQNALHRDKLLFLEHLKAERTRSFEERVQRDGWRKGIARWLGERGPLRPLQNNDNTAALEYMEKLIALSGPPMWENDPKIDVLWTELQELSAKYHPQTHVWFFGFCLHISSFYSVVVQIHLNSLVLCTDTFYQAHSRVPGRIEDFAEAYQVLITNPFTGKPYEYFPSPDGDSCTFSAVTYHWMYETKEIALEACWPPVPPCVQDELNEIHREGLLESTESSQ